MKRWNQYRDVYAGVIFLVISLAYYSGSFFETSSLMQAEYGPDFMPKIYAVLLGLLSVALIATGAGRARRYEAPEGEAAGFDRQAAFTAGMSLVCITAYIYLIKLLGFLIASFLYLFCQAWLLSPKKKNVLGLLVFAVIGAALIYLLFAKGIGLQLPRGIFGF